MRAAASLIPRGRLALLAVVPLALALLVGVSAALAATPTTVVFTATVTDCSGNTVTFTADTSTNTVTPSGTTLCVPVGAQVTLAATVSASTGAPTGKVVFTWSPTNDGTGFTPVGSQTLSAVDGTHSSASISVSLPTTTLGYLRATYQSSDTSTYATNNSVPYIPFSVQSVILHNTSTTITVNGLPSPGAITLGDAPAIVATVTPQNPADTTPPTGTVSFYDGIGTANSIADVPLVNGVATLSPTTSWTVGTHTIVAKYQGDLFYQPSSGNFVLTVNPGAAQTVATTTTVTATPSVIRIGDTVTFTAHVAQQGASTHPLGAAVQFEVDGNPVGDPVPLVFDVPNSVASGVATLPNVGSWGTAGPHTITAIYQGDTYNLTSSGTTSLSVEDNQAAIVSYVGPASVPVRSSSNLTAQLTDGGGNPLANETVTISTADGQSCVATTGADGTGSCGPLTFPHAGAEAVSVSFAGDATYGPTSGAGSIAVQPSASSIAYTGATHAGVNQPVTLSAVLTAPDGPLAGRRVVLTLNGAEQCAGDTDANGNVSCSVTTASESAGSSYPVVATFAGDADDTGSSATAQLQVDAVLATTLTYTGSTTATATAPVTLSYQLRDPNGVPVAGRTVSITLDGTTSTATTDANGVATVSVTAPAPGDYAVAGAFAGDGTYLSSSGSGSLHVTPIPTALVVGGDSTVVTGHTATLTATLTDAIASTPLAGRSVTITVNGNASESCTATTSAAGLASCGVLVGDPARPAPYTVTATFTSTDPTYLSSTGTGRLTVLRTPTTVGYVGPLVAPFGSQVYLSGYLLAGGVPLRGETLTLSLPNNGGSCTATTGLLGIALCTTPLTLPKTPGTALTITVSFAGDDAYAPSTGTGTLTIPKAATTLVVDDVDAIEHGGTVTLGATLTRTADGVKLAGKTVTLTFGVQSCNATTNAVGHATCTITSVGADYGTKTSIGASFAGDDAYLPSTARSGSNPCVFGYAPGGGSFVIGDKDSWSTPITFWGSQWSKQNTLTYGSPSSFKGYSDSPSPTCNVPWTARTGNSTPPPNATLPPYMAVVVSTKVTQSGSVISGDVKKIVIVATNGGYAPNPGHAGTGTVVTTLCGG